MNASLAIYVEIRIAGFSYRPQKMGGGGGGWEACTIAPGLLLIISVKL